MNRKAEFVERPMLFSGAMVRAILDGKKTQTRRVVKPQPGSMDQLWPNDESNIAWHDVHAAPNYYAGCGWCAYGKAGDRLWVKETFCEIPLVCGKMGFSYRADGDEAFSKIEDGYEWMGKWKPSIFMPRKASRILLEIVSVRVERLKEISEEDVKSEGLFINPKYTHAELWTWDGVCGNSNNPVYAYELLWESINGAGSWDKNPWVWVVEFKRVEEVKS